MTSFYARGFGVIAAAPETAAERDKPKEINQELLKALEKMVDDEPCRHDHHGNCQTHDLSNPCNMAEDRTIIAKAKGQI